MTGGRPRRLAPLILVVPLVVVPAGCGSSSDSSSSAPEGEGSPTKTEFIAKADALCAASKAAQEPLRKHLDGVARKARAEEQRGGISDSTRRELAQTLGRIVAMAEESISRVQGLGLPKADAGQLEAIIDRTESAFEASLAYGAALENHQDAKAQAIAESGNLETRETADLAERYGFKVCGSQPQTG